METGPSEAFSHLAGLPCRGAPEHTGDNDFPTRVCDMTDTPTEDDESFAEETLVQAIENQLEAGEPAAAQATLNKLTLVGYEREETVKLMALVLAREIRQMLEQDRAFDLDSYEAQLRNLPDLAE
jgi:hypothetical protein